MGIYGLKNTLFGVFSQKHPGTGVRFRGMDEWAIQTARSGGNNHHPTVNQSDFTSWPER